MKIRTCVSAAALAAIAGMAVAAPVVDGVKDAGLYQNDPIWVQNQPTSFGDNVPQPPCTEDVSDAANVMTGVEMQIPLAQLGNISGGIKLSAFINSGGHDFISNQVSGGVGGAIDAPSVGDPRGSDFNLISGDQFLDLSGAAAATPSVDGTLDVAYGAPLFVQTTATSFGDGTDIAIDNNNGDEIDAIYAANDGTNLYLFFAGNMNRAFNKLDVFLDVDPARGQNQLRGDNPDVDFNGLNRMGDSDQTIPNNDGLIFDTGFGADFYIQYTHGDAGGSATFASVAEILDDPTLALGEFIGGGTATGTGGELIIDGDLGPASAGLGAGFFIALNNSNVGGVSAICPPPLDDEVSFGSEINAAYTHYDAAGNDLYILLTGNLQTNENLMVFFLDVGDTVDQVPFFGLPDPGQNQLLTFNVDIDFGALQRMAAGDVDIDDDMDPATPPVPTPFPGLTFDDDFAADHFLSIKIFDPNNVQWFANTAVMREFGPLVNFSGGNLDYGSFFGGDKSAVPLLDFSGPLLDAQPGTVADIFSNFAPRTSTVNNLIEMPALPVPGGLIQLALDNSNTAGVSDVAVGNPELVTTGAEIMFDLDELGWDGVSEIKLCAFLNAAGYGFLSNQVTGGLPTADELGDPRAVDFGDIPGNQYIVLPLFEGGPAFCVADVNTTNTNPGDAGYGEPDGNVDGADLSFYVENWLGGVLAVADVNTTNTNPGDAGYGAPDGQVDGADLSYFVEQWLAGSSGAGCP